MLSLGVTKYTQSGALESKGSISSHSSLNWYLPNNHGWKQTHEEQDPRNNSISDGSEPTWLHNVEPAVVLRHRSRDSTSCNRGRHRSSSFWPSGRERCSISLYDSTMWPTIGTNLQLHGSATRSDAHNHDCVAIHPEAVTTTMAPLPIMARYWSNYICSLICNHAWYLQLPGAPLKRP